MLRGMKTETWVPTDTFAARLLLLRAHLGLTMQEAADQAGLSRATWRTWEAGSHPRDASTIVRKIADTFGVDREWLMWGGALSPSTGSKMRPSFSVPVGVFRRRAEDHLALVG